MEVLLRSLCLGKKERFKMPDQYFSEAEFLGAQQRYLQGIKSNNAAWIYTLRRSDLSDPFDSFQLFKG